MEKTVKQRLIEFINHKGISQGRFERLCNLSNGYVNNLKKTVGIEKTHCIAEAFPELNIEWLLYGEGAMLKPQQPQSVSQSNFFGNNNYVVGSSNITGDNNNSVATEVECPRCGETIEVESDSCAAVYPLLPKEVLRAPDTNVSEWLRANRNACKRIDIRQLLGHIDHAQPMLNRAMEPRIPEGSILFLSKISEWDEVMLDGSIYGVDVARPHMIVRKVYDEGDFIRCEPINGEFGAVRVSKDKVMDLYKIKAVIKVM